MKIEKPLSLAKEDFQKEITNLINSSGLPLIILEPIIKDVYQNIKVAYKQQLEADRAEYAMYLSTKQDEQEN